MAQLLRLSRCSRNVGVESRPNWKDYLTATSTPFRFLSGDSRQRNKCYVKDQQANVRYSSEIAKTKPYKDKNLGQSLWKKKKKKNSVVTAKVHDELFSVLSRRAVQLVFSRENKLMQRTLVTNFSFMDFPLHESAEAFNTRMSELLPQEIFERVPLDKDSALSLQVSSMSWQSQVSSFEKQLDDFVLSGKQRNHSIVIDDSHLFGKEKAVSSDTANRSVAIDDSHLFGKEKAVSSGSVSDSRLFRNKHSVSTGTASKHSVNLPPAGDFSQSTPQQAAAWPQVSDTTEILTQVSQGAVDSKDISSKQYVIPAREKTLSSPGVTLTKVVVARKRKSTQKEAVAEPKDRDLGVLRNGIYDDLLEPEQEDEIGPDLQECLAEDSLLVPEHGFFSKQDMLRLQKLKAKQEKFQSDPAKFNHQFNQELLAFVEACCFAGMEDLAFQVIKVYQYYRQLSDSNMPSGMHQVHDVNIFNRLMQMFARKCQLSHIKELLGVLVENGLRPNMQTYAALWECLGRHDAVDLAEGHRLLQQMETEGLDIRELFNKCVFVKDEQEYILKAILAVDPSYKANSPELPEPPKGPLVDSLKIPLDKVVEKNPYAGILSREEAKKLMETQMQRELRNTTTIKSILKQPAPSHRTLQYKKKLEKVKEEWRSQLTKAFEKKLRFMARKKREEEYGMSIYPYLKLFEPQEYVRCLLQEVEELALSSESFSPAKQTLWLRVSERIYTKYVIADKIRNEVPKKVGMLYDQYLERYLDADLDLTSHRQIWQQLLQQHPQGPSLDGLEKVWPDHVYLALGKILYEIIIYDLKFDSNLFKSSSSTKNLVPAFYTIYRHYAHQIFEEVKPHPVLVKLYKGADIEELTFDTCFLPMLVPPVPWLSPLHGGYLFTSAGLVRLPSWSQRHAQKLHTHEVPPSQLATVLDSINTLSACAWIINKPVLNVIIDVFNKNGNAALDIPPPASHCPLPPKITDDMTAQQRSEVHRQRLRLKMQKAEMYSRWCQELYKLSIASKFSDDVFWFPHNLDFRGRTYPCPPHFNHLGSDVTRSILMFAKGKPLGEKGLDWMKIHLINLTGFKKRRPNRERLAYANELLPEILDSADNPMTGNKWWQKSDEPWQTLACCMEIAKAIRSPNHTEYVCHLPIHQDGSCNGLQHYAALGRDQAGAQSVNLWPYDSPQDVYSDVCELVEKERQKDEAEGVEIAKLLKGFVLRKVIKQTVMTTVYGVTRYGAKAQILRQLKDIPDFPKEHAWKGSMYLTDKTFLCLNEMFSSTKDIQDWLTLSAQLISTVCQQPVQWVTPVGLTIVQPYHKPVSLKRLGVTTNATWTQYQKPDSMKQKNAFPPNFIHSLDSTHMMLTALHCMKTGITFVSVHDCFWTHACDVEIMNKVCRQQFVALHKHPILEDLSRQLVSLYTPDGASLEKMEPAEKKARQFLRNVLGNVPRRGDFDLEKVLESTYFFS